MIYNFTILNDKGIRKQFYMTADSPKDLYRRVLETYRVTEDRIEIEEYFVEEGVCEYNKTPIKYTKESTLSKKEKKILDKSIELFSGAKKKAGKKKDEYIKKYSFREITVSSADDVAKLLNNHKKIKVYWEPSKKRGEHRYYALVK